MTLLSCCTTGLSRPRSWRQTSAAGFGLLGPGTVPIWKYEAISFLLWAAQSERRRRDRVQFAKLLPKRQLNR